MEHILEFYMTGVDANLKPFLSLLKALKNPFEETLSNQAYRNPAIRPDPNYQTFCGT